MSAVLTMRMIALDANGIPIRHAAARDAAARELADVINEMPDGYYHMVSADLELAAERVIERYLHVVRGERS